MARVVFANLPPNSLQDLSLFDDAFTTPTELAYGGLGGSQAAAAAASVPVFPGSGGAAVPTTLASIFASPPPLGNVTPNTIAGTSISATGSVSAGGAITGGGFLGNFYNQAGLYPASGNGLGTGPGFALGTNFSNGAGEIDLWNTNVGFSGGFRFYGKTAASAATLLLDINRVGNITGPLLHSDMTDPTQQVLVPTFMGSAQTGGAQVSITTTWSAGLPDTAFRAQALINSGTTVGGSGGAIYGGVLIQDTGHDPFGILGVVRNIIGATHTTPYGAAIWALTRDDVATVGGTSNVNLFRATAENTDGQHAQAGFVINSSTNSNSVDIGIWITQAVTAGYKVGGYGALIPTYPFALYSTAPALLWYVDATGNNTGRTFTSTVATGTAPLVVASTTLVANLHAAVADSAPSYVPLAGGTFTGGIGFSTTNTLDIGTSATVLAPRTIYAGTSFSGPAGVFTTSTTSPLSIGGAGTTGTQKTFQTTTGNGTTDAFAFKGGNNGATTFATLSAAGLGIGVAVTSDSIVTVNGNIKLGTASSGAFDLGDVGGAGLYVGAYRGTAAGFGAGGNYLNLGGYDGVTITTGNVAFGSQTQRLLADVNGNVVVGTAALATNATNGFFYIPTCAGTPTGTPTAYAGRVPLIYDTTNDKLYIYSTTWKQPKVTAVAAIWA